MSCGNQIINAMSNFADEAEEGTYVSAECSNYFPGADKEDLSDAVLMLSTNNNYSQKVAGSMLPLHPS
eukprot:586781-Ditylum_brightwellii.AAC.1